MTSTFTRQVPDHPADLEQRARVGRQEDNDPRADRRTVAPCRLFGQWHGERFLGGDPTTAVAAEQHGLDRSGATGIQGKDFGKTMLLIYPFLSSPTTEPVTTPVFGSMLSVSVSDCAVGVATEALMVVPLSEVTTP